MTSKEELNVVASIGYQPVNSRCRPKSTGLTSDKILSLSDESLLKGEDRKKKNTIHKSGSSNPLVDKTKSILKLSSCFCVFFGLKSGIAKQQDLCK